MAIKSKGTSGTTYHDQDVIALIDSGHCLLYTSPSPRDS